MMTYIVMQVRTEAKQIYEEIEDWNMQRKRKEDKEDRNKDRDLRHDELQLQRQ